MKEDRIIASSALLILLSLPSAHGLTASESDASAEDQQRIIITRGTAPPMRGPAQNFTGSVHIDPLFRPKGPFHVSASYVTFEPCARTAWHTHPFGQTLIVTSGMGRVQRWGDAVQVIHVGDVVWIPPGQKHWHGASPTTAMTHIAIQEGLDGKNVEWMEPVTDKQYGK